MIKFNKTQWRTYKLGDIASNISERAEPKETKLAIYVGLEHLDPDCIHIKRRGHPSDVKGTKLRVYPGDIIFGKRRAYQRKAAIVDFDGICSAHAMVVRANPDVILPELLPFFMHSDVFMHRAVDVSEGSLSPTIKWKILAEQEFEIPPLDDQKRIADLLWSIDAALEKKKLLLKSILDSLLGYINQSLSRDGSVKASPKKRLGDCLSEKPMYGTSASAKAYASGSPRYVRITDIDDEGRLNKSDIVSADLDSYDSYILREDDFLFARTGNTVGKTYLYKQNDGFCIYAGYLIRFRVDKNILLPEFLHAFTHSSLYEDFKKNTVKVGAQPNINSEEYQNMWVPVPSIIEQEKIAANVHKIKKVVQELRENIGVLKRIHLEIINQIFG